MATSASSPLLHSPTTSDLAFLPPHKSRVTCKAGRGVGSFKQVHLSAGRGVGLEGCGGGVGLGVGGATTLVVGVG